MITCLISVEMFSVIDLLGNNRNSVVVVTVCKNFNPAWTNFSGSSMKISFGISCRFDTYDVALNLFHKEKPQDCTGGECMLKIDWNVKESTYVSYLLFWSFSHIHSSMDLRPTSLMYMYEENWFFFANLSFLSCIPSPTHLLCLLVHIK